jgi:hypothetical protein
MAHLANTGKIVLYYRASAAIREGCYDHGNEEQA